MGTSFLDLNQNAQATRLKVGNEFQPFLQIDSFMQDAGILRKIAIDMNKFSKADTFYPGVRMPISTHYSIALIKNLHDILKADFGCTHDKITSCTSSYSIVATAPEDLTLFQKIPHFDSLSTKSIAFVHYLCDHESTGTSLYRHKSTGYEYIDKSRAQDYTQQLRRELDSPGSQPEGYITQSGNVFDQIHTTNSKFNRIIAYRGSSLHSGNIPEGASFSTDPAVGRLTITTLIEFD